MTMYVEGQAYIDVEIEGVSIPTGSGTYVEVMAFEGLGDVVPSAIMTVNDATGTLRNALNVVDGTKVTISIRRDQASPMEPEVYRVFGKPRVENTGAKIDTPTYTLVLDVPKWYARILRTAYQGTSATVISKIAIESGIFDQDIDDTIDDMTWQCLQKTAGACALDIAKAGYLGPTSCMSIGLRANKTLFYRDIMQVATGTPVLVISNAPTGTEVQAVQIRATSSSGFSNNSGNYGTQLLQQEGDGANTIYSEAQAKLTETDLPINEAVKLAGDGVRRVTFANPDSGNVNKNFQQGAYQNERMLKMFCEGLDVLTNVVSTVQIGTCVEVKNYDENQALHVNSGLYLVARKTRVVRNGNAYGERLTLLRHQVDNEQGITKLADDETPLSGQSPNTLSIPRSQRLEEAEESAGGLLKSAQDLGSMIQGSTGSIIDTVTRVLNIDLTQLGALSAQLKTIHPMPTVGGLGTRLLQQFGSKPDLTSLRALQVLQPKSLVGALQSDLADRLGISLPDLGAFSTDVQRLSRGVLNAQDFQLMGAAAGLNFNPNVLSTNLQDLTKMVAPNVMKTIRALNTNGYQAISQLATQGQGTASLNESTGIIRALSASWDLDNFTGRLAQMSGDLIKNPQSVAAAWGTQTTWFEGWTSQMELPAFLNGTAIGSVPDLMTMMRTAKIPLNTVPTVLNRAAATAPSQASTFMDDVMSWAVPQEARNLGQTRDILARVVSTFSDWKASTV